MVDESLANLAWRLSRLEAELKEVRAEMKALKESGERVMLVVLGIFGTLTVFGLGTAITLLTTHAGG